MESAHHLILLAGALGLVSVFAGLLSARAGAPLLLVFLALGMLAGEEGPGGLKVDDFGTGYLVGSIALAVILFEGGLRTKGRLLRLVFWPALALATAGVVVTAGLLAAGVVVLVGAPWAGALLVGAAVAPTDAAAVANLLRRLQAGLPERVTGVLEVESGLNDPMSVFLTLLFTQLLLSSGDVTWGGALLTFAREMIGGGLLGCVGGYALLLVLRGVDADQALLPVIAFLGALTLFGATQSAGASGFLAVYVAGIVVGTDQASTDEHEARSPMVAFFEAFAWLTQIALFLMLGLLVTPSELLGHVGPSLAVAAVLLLVARPVACFACLRPFGFTARETAFVSWVGLRGAVPIYLAAVPILSGVPGESILFGAVFTIVVISLVIQGWTALPAARLLGFGPTRRRSGGEPRGPGAVRGGSAPAGRAGP